MGRLAPASLLALLALCLSGLAQPTEGRRPGGARLANADEVRQRLGLLPEYSDLVSVEALKIAVLDYGFDGVGRRAYLPASAVVVEDYDPDFVRRHNLGDPAYRKPLEPGNRHGRTMAQIIWAMTGSRPGGPQFFLLNANGPTMLRRAIRYAIEQKVDLILFSGSFEGGGNGDGRGPINRYVGEALAAGILWVNSAGNYGGRVYNGPVRLDPDGYLRFRDGPDGTALRFRNRLDENTVTVTLTWNDYGEEEDAGTNKDLDLSVEDPSGRVLAAGDKKQVSGDREPGPGESKNPRERVVLTDLPADLDGNYRIRIRARSNNFTAADRIRVLVTAGREGYIRPTGKPEEGLTFFDATGTGELYPPADNPQVLTVGDNDAASALGPTADNRVKPDVLLDDSRAYFTDGEVTAGSSNAAAYVAGAVAVLKAAAPGLRMRHLFQLVRPQTTRRTREILPPPTPTDLRPARRQGPSVALRLGRAGQVTLTLPPPPYARPSMPSPPQSGSRQLRTAPAPAVPSTTTGRRDELLATIFANRFWRTPSWARLAELVRTDGSGLGRR
jgi:hypothetical protein